MAVMEEMLETLQRIERKLDNLPEAASERGADPEDRKAVFDAKELSEFLGLENREAVYYQTKKGRIPHIRLGNSIKYPKAAIRKWLLEGAKNNYSEDDVEKYVEDISKNIDFDLTS
ncbi:MAG: helix-turn-helix domain-containing protein [Halanaerobiales bacterium]|nr:helix-turn-helix domain-containing protein [Halanaerobiales bacterium]